MTKHISQLTTAAHANIQYDPIQYHLNGPLIRSVAENITMGGTSSHYACETSLGFNGQAKND